MVRVLGILSATVQGNTKPTMEQGLYRLLCLIAALLAFFVVLPLDLIQHLSPLASAAVLCFGLGSCFFFRAAGRGSYHYKSFFALLVLLLNATWFLVGASKGSVAYYFFLPIIFAVLLFRGRTCLLLTGLFGINCLLLFGSDYLFPGLATPFQTDSARSLDLVIGFVASSLACFFGLKVVVISHDNERQRIAVLKLQLEDALSVSRQRAEDLEQSLNEVRTLRGLLPICSYCKKIRNDVGAWTQLEVYMRNHAGMDFSHGICPDCFEKHLPEYSNPTRRQ